jgi:hypothetical protein
MASTLPPEHTPRPSTGEHPVQPENGEKLFWCYLNKWGKIAALIVVSGAAGGWLRSCVVTGAGVVGLQTVEEAEIFEIKNVEAHNNMWEAIGKLETQAKEAVDNTNTIIKGMPRSWRNRAMSP